MYIEAFLRSMMKDNFSDEEFLLHVVNAVEVQLKEWDDIYNVELTTYKGNYILKVHHTDMSHYLRITPEEVTELRRVSDYALDRKIWFGLARLDLVIRDTSGVYMSHVFPEITNQ